MINCETFASKKVKKPECGIGFLQRDTTIKQQELAGILKFRLIRNDKTHENMKYLIDLKNIFSKQLPKMPKEYIVKLVFDQFHEAMIILKNETKLIGGICFRIFET